MIKKIKKNISENKLTLALLINVIGFIITGILFGFLYETNDDYTMSLISETNEGSEYLIFINSFYGKFLKMINKVFPSLNWYGICMYILAMIGLSILTYLILKKVNSKVNIYLAILFISVYGIDIYYQMQFTKVAVLLMISGILLVNHSIKIRKSISFVLGSLVFIIGSMLRFSAINIVIVFVGLFSLVEMVQSFNKKGFNVENVKKVMVFPLICILLGGIALTLKEVDSKIYNSNEELSHFLEYNKSRAKVQDYEIADYNVYEESYKKIGINKIDVEAVKSWVNGDVEKFDIDAFNSIREIEDPELESITNAIKITLPQLLNKFLFEYKVAVSLLVIILFYGFAMKKSKKWYLIISMVGVLLLYIVLNYRGRLPYRVEYGIWLCAFIISLYSFREKIKLKINSKIMVILIIMVSVMLNVSTYEKHKDLVQRSQDSDIEELIDVVSSNRNNIYFYTTVSMLGSFESLSPFTKFDFGTIDNLIGLGGWSVNSERMNNIWRKYEVNNPLKDVAIKENAYLIDTCQVDLITEYIRQNYYPNIKYELEGNIGKYNLYKLYLDEGE